MTDYLEITNFINDYDIFKMNPYRLHAEISSNYYGMACQAIKNVINNKEKSGILGYSSGGMRCHLLFRADNNELFVVHNAYGSINDAFYFTKNIMEIYFEDDNSMPEWEESEDVKNILKEIENI